MRKAVLLLFLLQFTAIPLLFSQTTEKVAEESKSISYPIDGTHLLWKEEQKVAEFLKANPNYFEQAKLNKTAAWNFSVGSTKNWYVEDFTSSQTYSISTTCRAVGVRCYIFVQNSEWNTRVNQVAVDSIKAAFDSRTPADATKGIYQTNTETFGDAPDVDNDGRLIIVLQDIKDGYDGSGGYIVGYFDPSNEVSNNKAEMFFIDTNPLDLRTSSGLEGGMSTLAHEFQHMIHWNYHRTSSQMTFINEGCSLVAEVINGYPIYNQDRYINETNHYLFDWRSTLSDDVLKDYSRAARLNVYFLDQFGTGIFKKIVQTQMYGLNAYTDALSKVGSSITFKDLLKNWFIANNLDDKTIDPFWGYTYPDLSKPTGNNYWNPNVSSGSALEPYAAEYLTFRNGSNLKVTFSSVSSVLSIKAVEKGTNQKRVVDIPLNGTFEEPEFGSTYNTVTFIIMNPENSYEQAYTYKATGNSTSVELKWDETETVGYLKRPPSDSICVTFDGVLDGRLDSIRLAARRIGTITGAVYNYTGTTKPSPLGAKISEFFTITSTYAPPVINPNSAYPYTIPYPNWLTVNLSGQNIKTDNPFAIAFGIPQDTSKYAYIMVTKTPDSGPYHNYTYQSNPSSATSSPGWYIITDGAGSIWVYLVRAYIGFENTTKVVELQPSSFKLEQNYPNPFNPETKIRFRLEKSGFTKLTIYDIMGREIKTLLNDFVTAGQHEVSFKAGDFSSGVYYYKLQSNDAVSMKKMMLMK